MSRRDRIKDLYAVPSDEQKLALIKSTATTVIHQPGEATTIKPVDSDVAVIQTATTPPLQSERVPAGPVRSMGLAFGRIEEENKAIHQALAAGATVVDLDPSLIEGSIVRDRLGGIEALDVQSLRRSIEERGQEVPILVRPHPSKTGRFQIAYGHRRLRAVSFLGRKVRAVVREMSDAELIVAQGIENSERRDLSYIERALFAHRLEARGFDRVIIMQALSVDKTELSRLIAVARDLPESLIVSIGPAPKTGRDRWVKLAKLLESKGAAKAAEKAIADPEFGEADSDTRFLRVFAAGSGPMTKSEKPQVIKWKSEIGPAVAKVTKTGKGVELFFDSTSDPGFAEFVTDQLDQLYSAFRSRL